ncbi:hypothetical protein MTO96_002762 [Rhipicephalus appendiculatus]
MSYAEHHQLTVRCASVYGISAIAGRVGAIGCATPEGPGAPLAGGCRDAYSSPSMVAAAEAGKRQRSRAAIDPAP